MQVTKSSDTAPIDKMGSYLAILNNEFQAHIKFIFLWILGLNAYFLMAVMIYPGEEAVNGFLNLVNSEEAFKALLGSIGGESPGYRTWLALMLPFIVTAQFIYALMVGVRLASKSISDDTGELIHPQPITRTELLLLRYSLGIFASFFMIFISSLALLIPVQGESIPVENIITFFWPGWLFMNATVALGMILGIIAADTGRGYMFSLFISIYLYAMQTMSNIVSELAEVSEYIPLNWYSPSSAILSNEVPENTILYMVVMLLLSISVASFLFNKRDLIKEAAIPIPIISGLTRRLSNGSKDKSSRDRLLVAWAKPLEKKLPFTSDFIYSEYRAILITFWAIILFYPAQILLFRPNDPEFITNLQTTIDSFGSSGIMKIFSYGHDLSSDLYLWFIITNAIGNHYFIFVPLTAHWIKKILQSDADELTGEIYGGLPIKSHKVMLERLLAVLLELLFIVMQMVIWLVICELAIGISTNQLWRVISILTVIPLYIFLISAGLTVGLLIKNGVKIARITLVGLVLWFIAGILLDGPSGIFGLYDPVLIITEKSILVANNGILWLTGIALLFSVTITLLAPKYDWLDIPDADKSIKHHST